MNKKKNLKILKFPKNLIEAEREVEAILFSADEPLDLETIKSRMKTKANILKILESLVEQYKNRGINLICIKEKPKSKTIPLIFSFFNLRLFILLNLKFLNKKRSGNSL